jgi:cytidyltransferase-like protein
MRGKKIVFTSGVFDLLHLGHFRYLEDAKSHGDTLIVGIDGDSLVKKFKGNSRPLFTSRDRAEQISGCTHVDAVSISNDISALIRTIHPDTLIISPTTNFPIEKRVFFPIVRELKIPVIEVPSRFDVHSSDLVALLCEK